MPADPVAAGKKGGSRNTAAQRAARRANGFQPVKSAPETRTAPTPEPAPAVRCGTFVLTTAKEETK
jgi:hypothetical protein